MITIRHIFVIDDEVEIRQLISKYIENEGYKATTFSNGMNLLSEIQRLQPDLLVLDIMMPGLDGLELCRTIRKHSEVPIIFVSARGEEIDRIVGLELGADDYISKPFSPRELMVRIKNIFKRSERTLPIVEVNELHLKDLVLYKNQRTLEIKGQNINLTAKEFDTFRTLLENKNIPLTREQLLDQVWGYDYFGDSRTVDDIIKRLRKKIKEANTEIEIKTVWGFGYKIEDEH